MEQITLLINVETSKSLSSNYLYCNYLRTRTPATNDMLFEGANTTGNGYTEFMRLRKDEEDVMLSKDFYMVHQRLYLHKGTSQDIYFYTRDIASVNHLEVVNEDPNGEVRFTTNGTAKMYIRANDMVLGAGVVFSGDFQDTSDLSKKYDIKDAEYDFAEIIKQIKPKTFRMKDEKEIGIHKKHIGFVADDFARVLPEEVENIVNVNSDGIKTLNYMKLTSILWGAMKEQQIKIQHLESSVYELREAMKELIKPKPKSKAKAKTEK